MHPLHRVELLDTLLLQPGFEGLPTPVAFGGVRNRPEFNVQGKGALVRPSFLLQGPAGAVILCPSVKALEREQQVPIGRLTAFGECCEARLEFRQRPFSREGKDDRLVFLTDDLDLARDLLELSRIMRRAQFEFHQPSVIEPAEILRRTLPG